MYSESESTNDYENSSLDFIWTHTQWTYYDFFIQARESIEGGQFALIVIG